MSEIAADLSLEVVDDLDAAREEWTRLADAAGSPFSTWEWAAEWWPRWGRGELRLVVCRDAAGGARALLPLYRARRGPLRILRFVGHGVADQLAPVCAPEDRPLAAAALKSVLAEPHDLLVADRLPSEQGWSPLLGGRVLARQESPVLDAGGASFEEWLATRSKNFRDQVRGRERKLARKHELSFRLSDAGRLDADFDALVALHRARWGETSGSFDPPRDAFHREFARRALERGWLRLWMMELDGRVAAAWLGYRMGGAEWYYQAGRNPALERESIGFVLLAHTIRSALDDGIGQYKLLLGGESYKDRFATGRNQLETLLLPRSAAGRAAGAVARAAASGPSWLRAPLSRRLR
jgi:CelD/BcsL family acetyltransferase involved in cellulose biosynthesis